MSIIILIALGAVALYVVRRVTAVRRWNRYVSAANTEYLETEHRLAALDSVQRSALQQFISDDRKRSLTTGSAPFAPVNSMSNEHDVRLNYLTRLDWVDGKWIPKIR
jgi:hypothetical protein